MKNAFLFAMTAFALSACLSTNTKNGLSNVSLGTPTYEVMAAAGPPGSDSLSRGS